MNTAVQIIKEGKRNAFAIVPYENYLYLVQNQKNEKDKIIPPNDSTPHEVVGAVVLRKENPITAWRKYLHISQVELAKKLGVTQGTISQIEKNPKNQKSTLERVANALGISLIQLKF